MNSKKSILLLFFVLSCMNELAGQASYRLGTIPGVNISSSLGDSWKANFGWESRQDLAGNLFTAEAGWNPEIVLHDFSVVASRKVGINYSLAGGYLLRIRDRHAYHRAIQQFTLVGKYARFRLAHRLAADQTFSAGIPAEYRFRYRFAAEIPLSGESVDPKEVYIKISNEYLNAFQDDEYDLEIRMTPFIGYEFTDNNKLEFGMDYRVDSFLYSEPEHVFWLSLKWFITLKG